MKRLVFPLFSLSIIWAMWYLKASIWFRAYPAAMVAIFFAMFFSSLFKTPLIEVFARKFGHKLDGKGVEYCRKATIAWCVFLFVHLSVTVWTCFATLDVWAFYNGFLAYVLLGAMFAGEWLTRRRVRRG